MQRKPPLNIGKIPNPPAFRAGQGSTSSQVRFHDQANQGPEAAEGRITYDDINNAIEGFQGRRTQGSSPQRPGLAYDAPQRLGQPMPPRPPSVSSSTLAGNEADVAPPQSSYADSNNSKIRYSQSGVPMLPTINSGDAFDWGDLDARATAADPFADAAAQEGMPLQQQSRAMEYAQGYAQPQLPPPPPAMMVPPGSASEGYAQQAQGMHVPGSYSEYDGANAYSRPPSAYPSTRPPSAVYSSYNGSSYPSQPSPTEQSSYYAQGQTHTLSSQGHYSHSAESHGAHGLPTHYNAQGELIVDQYGGESGAYSTAVDTPPRHTMRSRSATPMGPGSEYVVVDEEGYDEEDYEYDPSDQTHDPEKGGYEYEDGYEPTQHYDAGGGLLALQEKLTPITEYPETPVTTQHYGPVPVGRVTRRNKQKKRVQLTHGNLALELPVPSKLVLPLRREQEMMTTRYTAVTCDPDYFAHNNFVLRQNLSGRSTEMFIVITMYNVSYLARLYAGLD